MPRVPTAWPNARGWRGWATNTVVVNLQGDEPFAPAAGIRAVAQLLADGQARMSTLAAPITEAHELFDPNVVKLVRDDSGHALYFSRAPIPGTAMVLPPRAGSCRRASWLRHIGIYGYRAGFLQQFAAMPPGRLEQAESLEQLRVLEAGYRIAVTLTPEQFPPGIDTPKTCCAPKPLGERLSGQWAGLGRRGLTAARGWAQSAHERAEPPGISGISTWLNARASTLQEHRGRALALAFVNAGSGMVARSG